MVVRVLINTLIGVILIFFWLKFVDFSEIWQNLTQVNGLILIPVIFFLFFANFLRAIRLKILLKQYHFRLWDLVLLNQLSQFLSFLIPIRAGEITKGMYLSHHTKNSFSKSVVWILIDRFLDFWLILLLAEILLIIIPTNLPMTIIYTLAVLITISTVGFIVLLIFPKFIQKVSLLIIPLLVFSRLKKIVTQLVDTMIDGSLLLRQGKRHFIIIMSITLLALIVDAIPFYILFSSVSGTNPDSLKIFLGQMLSALTYLIPAAPGYVGSIEASGLAIFTFSLGFEHTLVSTITVLLHALLLIYILIFGLMGLYLLKFDLRSVWKHFQKR